MAPIVSTFDAETEGRIVGERIAALELESRDSSLLLIRRDVRRFNAACSDRVREIADDLLRKGLHEIEVDLFMKFAFRCTSEMFWQRADQLT
jgi:hypothetical protein